MGRMVFEEIVQRFVDQRPIAVMTRVILERQFSPEFFDDTFGEVAQEQYVSDLTFLELRQIAGSGHSGHGSHRACGIPQGSRDDSGDGDCRLRQASGNRAPSL